MAHSLARLSPKYSKDILRWTSLGWTEAEWMCSNVYDYYDYQGPSNPYLSKWGLKYDEKKDIRNPYLEETLPSNIETLTNYRGWFYGKLDWALTRALTVVKQSIGNNDYEASDHKSILLECFLDPTKASDISQEVLTKHNSIVSKWGKEYSVLPNTLKGHLKSHSGVKGYLKRNCTKWVMQ